MKTIAKANLLMFVIFMFLAISGSIFVTIQAGYDAEESTEVSTWFTDVTIKIFEEKSLEQIKISGKPMDLETFRAFIRKFVGHFGIFAFIGISFNIALDQIMNKKISISISVVYSFLLAILTEFIQSKTPGRYGAFSDIILDTQGALLSIFGLCTLFSVLNFLREKLSVFNFVLISTSSILFEILYVFFNDGNANANICNCLFIMFSAYMFTLDLVMMVLTHRALKKRSLLEPDSNIELGKE